MAIKNPHHENDGDFKTNNKPQKINTNSESLNLKF